MRTGDMKNSWSLFRGQWADPSAAQQPSGHAPIRARVRVEETGQRLALEDDKAYVGTGYNPYDTVVHVKNTRSHDVWRNKPKRD